MKTTDLLFVALLVAGLLLTFFIYRLSGKRRTDSFRARDEPLFEQWYEEYYRSDSTVTREEVKPVLDVIAKGLGVKPTQLRPGDRLDKELCLQGVPLDDSWDFFDAYLAKVVKASGRETRRQSATWRTLDDVIRGTVALSRPDSPPNASSQNQAG